MLLELTAQREIADLLSQITDQDIKEEEVDHRLIFTSLLIIVLAGVMYSDHQLTKNEKQAANKIINEFIPKNSHVFQLALPFLNGINRNKTYLNYASIEKLSKQLNASEKLLIIALSKFVAAADSEVAPEENAYIGRAAKIFRLDAKYFDYIFGIPTDKVLESDSLCAIHSLLDPHHFQGLDPVFMEVSDRLRAKLPQKSNSVISRRDDKVGFSYEKLEQFKQLRQQLSEIGTEVLGITQRGLDQDILSEDSQDKAFQAVEKLKSQRFRLAVVGEFSQGKSTLLNALLGQEIQPARAIPCSGTVTVLKYGDREKVICHYKDGRKEEIPVDRYHELASISKEAALSNMADELAKSTIKEIVFEHPKLELCRQQVEIVDSPGLNEHPERTAITEQLLEDADAAIFLANASRPLTQGERDLIKGLQAKLQGDGYGQPAQNLFVLVNFMDLLRREKDRVEVKELFERFLQGEIPIIEGPQRLHFISAQAALDSILEGKKDEFLLEFERFVDALQTFLSQERGALVLQRSNESLQRIIEECRADLKRTEHLISSRISLSEVERDKILHQMSKVAGRKVRIRQLTDILKEEAIDSLTQSWNQWLEGIGARIVQKSEAWKASSEKESQILTDYAKQFERDVAEDLDSWIESSVKAGILMPKIQELKAKIDQGISDIQNDTNLKPNLRSSSALQSDLLVSRLCLNTNSDSEKNNDDDSLGFWTGLGGAGSTLGLLAIAGVGFMPLLIGGAIGGAIGGLLGGIFSDSPKDKARKKVLESGFSVFESKTGEIIENLREKVATVLEANVLPAIDLIRYVMSCLDDRLAQENKDYEEEVSLGNYKQESIEKMFVELNRVEDQLGEFSVLLKP